MNGFLHKLSPCPLYVIFDRKKYKKKSKKRRFRKKQLYICFTFLCLINILHLFKEAYFCFGADSRFPAPLRYCTICICIFIHMHINICL